MLKQRCKYHYNSLRTPTCYNMLKPIRLSFNTRNGVHFQFFHIRLFGEKINY